VAVAADAKGSGPSCPVSKELRERAAAWIFHSLAHSRIFRIDNAHVREQDRLLRQFPGDQGEKLQTSLEQYAKNHRAYLLSVTTQFRSKSSVGSGSGSGRTEGSSDSPPVPVFVFSQQPRQGAIGMAAMTVGDVGLHGRRLFRTDEGWIGKGPESMVPGDEVWIVPGGKVPFILRPKGDGLSRYVGHGYVHGIMGGEAATRFSNLEMQEVALK